MDTKITDYHQLTPFLGKIVAIKSDVYYISSSHDNQTVFGYLVPEMGKWQTRKEVVVGHELIRIKHVEKSVGTCALTNDRSPYHIREANLEEISEIVDDINSGLFLFEYHNKDESLDYPKSNKKEKKSIGVQGPMGCIGSMGPSDGTPAKTPVPDNMAFTVWLKNIEQEDLLQKIYDSISSFVNGDQMSDISFSDNFDEYRKLKREDSCNLKASEPRIYIYTQAYALTYDLLLDMELLDSAKYEYPSRPGRLTKSTYRH